MSAKKQSACGPQQKTLFSFFGKPSASPGNKTPLKPDQAKQVGSSTSPSSDKNSDVASCANVVESLKENKIGTPLRTGGLKKPGETPGSVDRRVRFSVSDESKKAAKKLKDEDEIEVDQEDNEEEEEETTPSSSRASRRRVIVMSDSEDDDVMEVSEPGKDEKKKPQKRRAPSKAGGGGKRQRRSTGDGDEEEEENDDGDDSFIVDDDELDDEDDNEEPDFDEDDDDDDSGRGSKQKRNGKKTTPKARRQPSTPSSNPGTPISSRTKEKLSAFQSPAVSSDDAVAVEGDFTKHVHLSYAFIRPEKICDANGRRPDHPDYDPTTLYVPPDFHKQQTPALKQWWQMKSKYFDTVLCFKLGKFYELYHMDAVIAVNELGLIFMRGENAHAGFPESAYPRYADQLVQRGFKVGRVEQTETPAAAADRAKSAKTSGSKSPASDKEKVVRREMCQVVTAGTRTPDMMCGGLGNSSTGYLMAIAERPVLDSDKLSFGVAFVDTTIGLFYLSQFTDDRARSSLRTVIAANRPAQILTDRKRTSEETQRALATGASSALRDSIPATGPAWNAEATVKDFAKSDYFRPKPDSPEIEWPGVIAEMLSDPNSGIAKPQQKFELCLGALGALLTYLRRCLIDETLLSLRQFATYSPPDLAQPQAEGTLQMEIDSSPKKCSEIRNSRLVLDSITLRNLDLMENSNSGTLEGTLFELLDSCSSEFGRRQLREWISSPLTKIDEISDRQLAISELGHDFGLSKGVQKLLSKLPDLDRSLNKMHTFGHPSRSSGHPDSRAVMFEDDTYRKRRIEELVTTMKGFRVAVEIFKEFAKSLSDSDGFESKILSKCTKSDGNGGLIPEIEPVLNELETLFDLNEAKKTGKITPKPGLCPAYDEACDQVSEHMQNLEGLRLRYKKQLKVSKCEYFGSAKNRYQLEISEDTRVSSEFVFTSKRKGFKRYRTTEIDDEFAALQAAEERRETAMRDSMRATFAKFDEFFPKWQMTVRCLATIDCLLALATYSANADFCVPQFVDANEANEGKPFIAIERGAHPCLLPKIGSSLIANDTFINYNSTASSLILTGPNMGGKSTLMRQVGLLVVLAHLGCSVPAASMRLSPVDRIFTRMGASDRIMAGESTFYVELAETSVILQRATEHSLVLLDELGRGTATYDGLSVAAAVLEFLAAKIRCRTIFSTHYHLLVSTMASESSRCSKNVSLCHMACKVDNEKMNEGGIETITFLYQLVPGACPRSYGFNAARLAGLPIKLIEQAASKAAEFEHEERIARRFRSSCKAESIGEFFEKLKIVDRH